MIRGTMNNTDDDADKTVVAEIFILTVTVKLSPLKSEPSVVVSVYIHVPIGARPVGK